MINILFGMIKEMFMNVVFTSTVVSWFVSQLMKAFYAWLTSDKKKFSSFVKAFGITGGMPSSHSAVVTSLVTGMALKHGIASDYFVIAAFLAMIVIRDAVGVRRSNGLLAKSLNSLGKKLSETPELSDNLKFKAVKEVNGHKPSEVIVGCLVGFIIAIIFPVYIMN